MVFLTELFEEEELRMIQLAGRISSILALIGAISIVISYVFWPSFRRYGTRPILFMCVCSMLAASSTVMGRYYLDKKLDTACQIQAFNFQTFYVASSMWSSAIATSLILVVKYRVPPPNLYKYERYYHIVCWGIPLTIALTLLLGNHGPKRVFGDATFWCWTVDEYATFRIFFFFGVMWICFIYNTICYGTVGYILWQSQRRLRQTNVDYEFGSNQENGSGGSSKYSDWKTGNLSGRKNTEITRSQDKTMRRFTKRTSAYILAFMIIWTPGTVNRLQNIIDPEHPIYIMFVIHAFCLPIGGFMEAVIWFAPPVYKFVRTHIFKKQAKAQHSNSTGSASHRPTFSNGSNSSSHTYQLQTLDSEFQQTKFGSDWNSTMTTQNETDEISRGGLSNWADPINQAVASNRKNWPNNGKQRSYSGSADPLWNSENSTFSSELDTTWASSSTEATYTSPTGFSPPNKGKPMGILVQNSLANIPEQNSNRQLPDQYTVSGRSTAPNSYISNRTR